MLLHFWFIVLEPEDGIFFQRSSMSGGYQTSIGVTFYQHSIVRGTVLNTFLMIVSVVTACASASDRSG